MSGAPAFERLDPRLQRWLWKQGWRGLREIQERALDPILAREGDVLLAAATAAGKTEAAFLPIVSRILAEEARGVRALYVGPLKALINDQGRRLEDLCRGLDVPVQRWHGDVGAGPKQALLEDPRGVLLITPESLEALFVLRGTQVARVFAATEYVVVDELHGFQGTERGRQLQSLLRRLELALRRRTARVGLSATIGDLELAARFLRPEDPARVRVIEVRGNGSELRAKLRAYRVGDDDPEDPERSADAVDERIARHLFEHLRGSSNLVFAPSRREVEGFAVRLRRLAQERRLPLEFFPHHGSLARELREDLERRLRAGERPTTVVCTSTLELGIDLGAIESVAQIGSPHSVAALRQRLGRSGRRGAPAVLRAYVRVDALPAAPGAPGVRALHEELVRTAATFELLLAGWCEPPEDGLHLSTLVQQVLALVAQYSGVRADEAFGALCAHGPFADVGAAAFAHVLRSMAGRDLLVQDARGTLLAGAAGERLLEHYTFYSVFQSEEELDVVHRGETLGSLPGARALARGDTLVFAGRAWRVTHVDRSARRVLVEPGVGGAPPRFEGGPRAVHDRVRAQMRALYLGDGTPAYLDGAAREVLAEARAAFRALGLAERHVTEAAGGAHLWPWRGDRVLETLRLELRGRGLDVRAEGPALLAARCAPGELAAHLEALARTPAASGPDLARGVESKARERYDAYLDEELLCAEYAARALDPQGARECLCALVRA